MTPLSLTNQDIPPLSLGEELPWLECPEDSEKELTMNNQNQADAVQKIILQYPEHWLWIYKRWKVCPDGETNPYKKIKRVSPGFFMK